MSDTGTSWITDLATKLPVLQPIYVDHIRALGRPTPALFMMEVAQWIDSLVASGDKAAVGAFLADLGTAYPELDERARTEVDEGLVSLLPGPDEVGSQVSDMLSPTIGEVYARTHHGVGARTWVASLVRDYPSLGSIYSDHLEYHHRVLAHLLFADILRWLIALLHSGEHDLARSFVARVGVDYPGLNTSAQNVVSVSFIEDLPCPGDLGSEIIDWLTPALRVEYEQTHAGCQA
jgi:hypothetical protein